MEGAESELPYGVRRRQFVVAVRDSILDGLVDWPLRWMGRQRKNQVMVDPETAATQPRNSRCSQSSAALSVSSIFARYSGAMRPARDAAYSTYVFCLEVRSDVRRIDGKWHER